MSESETPVATDRQRGLIQAYARGLRMSGADLEAQVKRECDGRGLVELTREDAATLIDGFREREDKERASDPHDPTRFGLGTHVRSKASGWEGEIDAITSDGYTVSWAGWGTFPDSEVTADELELVEQPPVTFAIGDRVRITSPNYWTGATGTISGYAKTFLGMAVTLDDDPNQHHDWHFHVSEMEHIDASTQVDGPGSRDEPVSGGVAGSPGDDSSGAGASSEPATEEPSMASAESLEAQVATLTEKVDRLQRAGILQDAINDINSNRGEKLVSDIDLIGESVALLARNEHTTTRRMRVNISKSVKGVYTPDTTFEITSSDPDCNLDQEMAYGLRMADRLARQAIEEAEYTDAEGVPGADDTI